MSRASTSLALAVMCGGLLLTSACRLPVSSQVETIPREDHIDLLEGTTSTTVLVVEPESVRVALYFVGPNDQLERVVRPFPKGTVNDDVLVALEEGPLPTEIEELGLETLKTELPAGLAAQFGGKNGSSQTVDVDPIGDLRTIVTAQPPLGRLIVSQIVCTVLSLELEDVTGIEISDGEEESIQLSDINAEPLVRPVNKADFDDCRTGADQREAQAAIDATSTTTTNADG